MTNTWNEACMETLEDVFRTATHTPALDVTHGAYLAVSDGLASFVRNPDDGHTAVALMRHAASMSLHSLMDLLEEGPFGMVGEMHNLLCRKQHDYGHKNITNFGLVGVAVRMCDKIARLINMERRGGGSALVGEPLIDAYRDIVGYAVIAIMLHGGKFELELNTNAIQGDTQ